MLSRTDAKIAAMGVVCLVLGGVGTATAAGYDAKLAKNSDKVDGIHAVKADATNAAAANKLVALTAGGFLDGKFIPKVGDSELLDGHDSTDFLGSTAKAADADLLDGKDAGDFLGTNAKATDADKLDGKDSSAFLQKCQNGTIHGRVEITGSQVQPTLSYAGVRQNTEWLCTGERVMVRRDGVGRYDVVFGDVVHGNQIGYGTGNGPLPQVTPRYPEWEAAAYGPAQCASGNPPAIYEICFPVAVTNRQGAPTDGDFIITIQ